MNAKAKKRSQVKNPTLVGILVLVIAIGIVIFATTILYQRTVDLLTDNLRTRLLTISITAAANINADDLSQLRVESDWTKPEWARVVSTMNRAKYSNEDVVFMYIFRKIQGDPENMEFVADADSIFPYANTLHDPSKFVDVNRDGIIEPDGPDKLQWPGQGYPEAVDIPEAFAAYDGPLTSADLYTDEYGTVMTGYAPIRDNEGNTVAILATDIAADDFLTITTQTLRPFLIFIVSLAVIIVILAMVILMTWKKYAASLQVMNDQLKKLDKLKSEFLSFASHQVKAPMSVVKGYAQLIGDGSFGEVPDKVKETSEKIKESADRLIALVNNLLDLRKLEEGRMDFAFEDTDIAKLTTEVVNDLMTLAQKKKLELTVNVPPEELHGKIDIQKFRQVIQNLVDNSIKYTDSGWVKVSAERVDDSYVIKVSDSGRGMPKDLIPQLFEQFTREKDAAKRIEGTGLGLYIAKQIVLGHRGTIEASSEGVGKGSTFTITLPAA